MTIGGAKRSHGALSVLIVDSDPSFLSRTCKLIAEDGYQVWGAEDLLAAANFLADQTPDLLLVEMALLEADGADPLGDLRERASGAPIVLMASGPPNDGFRTYCETHEIFGYYDKAHGCEPLRLWVSAALLAARHSELIRQARVGLRHVLEAVPELRTIQPLDEVLAAILDQVGGLLACLAASERT
jgi:DNA-binding response OmpR family regulator